MKCFLVVNQLNDPFYIDYDEEFAISIIQKCKEKELLEADTKTCELDANLVMQLFSPMVLSQWLLIDQLKEPCSSITCPDGFRFVFKHVDELLYIAINGDGAESEEFLHRKIQVFITLMRFLFGPIGEEIGHSQRFSKKAKWAFLRKLMSTWSKVVETEQTFLIEAVEKLNVNQMVSEKCMEILEKSVKQIQSVQDHPIQHAVLLVNSRLLALYSKRIAHELRAKDILSLMVLSKTLYPNLDGNQDQDTPDSKLGREDNSDGGEEEYHSAPTTPRCDNRSRTSSVKQDEAIYKNPLLRRESSAQKRDDKQYQGVVKSTIKSDTLMDSGSFDQSSVKTSSSDGNVTLLDMYKEKYPDSDLRQDELLHTHRCRSAPVCQIVYADVHESEGPSTANEKEEKEGVLSNSVPVSERKGSKEINAEDEGKHSKFQENKGSSSDSENASPVPLVDIKCTDILEGTEFSREASADEKGHGSLEIDKRTVLPEKADSRKLLDQDLLSTASRSSSVLSNPIQGYPDLLPCGHNSSFDISSKKSTPDLLYRTDSQRTTPTLRNTPSPLQKDDVDARRNQSFSGTVSSSSRPPSSLQDSGRTYLPQTIFLETSTCFFSPYNVHTVQVLNGITLVLLSQAPKYAMADSLYQVMHNIQDLIHGRRSKLPRARSLHVYDIVNSLLGKLQGTLRKTKGREANLIHEIHSRWEREDMKNRFLEYLEKDSKCPMPPELETPLWEMYKKLRELFSLLFLHPQPESPHFKEMLLQLSDRFNAELLDYKDYLNVKAERNITMTSYIDDFPGLIHFIFIDRRLHQMTAPSLSAIHTQEKEANATAYLKCYIWRMYQHMMRKLTEGYTTVILKDGDFYFSYFLWFEDSKRKPLPVQDYFKPSDKLPYPGILCGSFYRDIIKQCFPHTLNSSVYCYEMFLMHLGNVHPQFIASHCKKLALRMWEMSGDAYSPLNLL